MMQIVLNSLAIALREGCMEKKPKKKSINDGFCFTHTYVHTYIKNHHLSVFFLSDGGKLSMKTAVEKKTEKIHHFTFFGYTYIHISIIDVFFRFFLHLSLMAFPFPRIPTQTR